MITSSQVAGMIGGQQVMFANQAAFAHQISGTMGFGPPMAGQLQNPYPSGMPSYGVAGYDQQSDAGNRIAGGAALSMPALASGVSLAGGLMGGGAGWLDPFTGVARGFARGAGFGGQGAMATMRGLGSTFASGGLRAGGAALAGGLGAAAITALPYYVAGKAIETVGENMYEGVQNIRDVGRMTQQHFQPAYGQAGATSGGQQGRGAIQQITTFLHEMASEDVMTSMRDMRKLMDQAGQMGMLSGVSDVQSFKSKFKKIIDQTKMVAQVLGTSLEEAMPMMGQMRQMGLWNPQDIMGTMASMKTLGPQGGQAMMGAMQSGAAMSHAMGGRMGAGAKVGQEMMMNVSSMMKAGTLTEEQIMEYTGGQGGAAGQQQVAQGLQQAMIGFSQHPMGQMMLAGLGEMKNDRFTGRMDPELMQKFLRGEISVDQLSQMGRKRVSNRTSQVSFFNRKGEMGQSMLSQGGLAGVSQGIGQMMTAAGYGGADEEIQNRWITMATQTDQRTADLLQASMKDLPRMQIDKQRSTEAAMSEILRKMEYRKTRSWQGFKDALSHRWEEDVERPIQQSMEKFSTDMGDMWDSASRRLLGMGPQAVGGVSFKGAMNLATGGYTQPNEAALKKMSKDTMQNWIDPGSIGNSMIEMTREKGSALSVLQQSASDTWMTPRAQMLARMGMGIRKGAAGAGDVNLGGGYSASTEDVGFAQQRLVDYASGPVTLGVAVGGGPTKEQRAAQDIVSAEVDKVLSDPANRQQLLHLKERDPEGYGQAVTALVKKNPRAAKALNDIAASSKGSDKNKAIVELGAVMTGMNEKGWEKSSYKIDLSKMANAAGPGAAKDPAQAQQDAVDALREAVGAKGGASQGAVIGGAIGAAAGFGILSIPLALAGASIGATIGELTGTTGLSTSELQEMANPEMAPLIIKAMEGGPGSEAAKELSKMGGTAGKVAEMIDKGRMSKGATDALKSYMTSLGSLETEKTNKSIQSAAKAQGQIEGISGIRGTMSGRLERLRALYEEGKFGEAAAGVEKLGASGELKEKEINRLLAGQGGLVGVQVGREAVISGLKGGMSEKDFMKQMQRLDLYAALPDEMKKDIAAKAKSGGKVDSQELEAIKATLKKAAEVLRGSGPTAGGGGGPVGTLEHLLVSYAKAHTDFVTAVNQAIPGLEFKDPSTKPKVPTESGTTNPPKKDE